METLPTPSSSDHCEEIPSPEKCAPYSAPVGVESAVSPLGRRGQAIAGALGLAVVGCQSSPPSPVEPLRDISMIQTLYGSPAMRNAALEKSLPKRVDTPAAPSTSSPNSSLE